MLKRIVLAATLALAVSGHARAEQVVVVELYTSQGCSSCPPADAILGRLAARDDVIPLALHVDYWDYIGWKDDFARPEHTVRQRGYARAMGEKMIYTPQMIVQGDTPILGNNPMDLADSIVAHGKKDAPVSVTLERAGDRVNVALRKTGRVPEEMDVHVVTYIPSATRSIRRGENAGRTLTYHNIVEDWRTVATWSGDTAYRASIRLSEGTPVVVIVQAPDFGPVLGAARLR